jgi:streptogramin lyase
MVMSRSYVILLVLGLGAVVLFTGLPGASQTTPVPSPGLAGTVVGADGKPMEGVAVSAKADGATITTSVWTNQAGAYTFPQLEVGSYQVWAQAVGFDRPVAQDQIASGKAAHQDFTLKPIQNFERQLSTPEWLDSLPDATSADRRMKMVILNECSNCHLPAFILEKRFDAAGWEILMNQMAKITADGGPPEKSAGDPPGIKPGGGKFDDGELDANGNLAGIHTKLWNFYRKDVIEYLARVRGPQAVPLKLKPFPRPTGEATQIVVTEYDLPREHSGDLFSLDPKTGRVTMLVARNGRTDAKQLPPEPLNEYRSGSDWSLGTRHEGEERAAHDIALGTDGKIYYGPNGMMADPRGYVWYGTNEFNKLDIETQTITAFPKVPVMSHGKDVDTKGYVWGSSNDGAIRMNTTTGEWTEFKAPTAWSRPYDLSIDRLDDVWFTELAVDKLGVVDGKTGKVTEVSLPPLKSADLRPEDIEVFNKIGSWDHNAALGQQGPRRLGADRNGNFVWAGLYWSGGIAKIDVRTKTLVGVLQVPNGRWAQPYKLMTDKNNMVWFSNAGADFLGKLDPTTDKFTLYPLPTRGTNSRHLAIDNSTDPPTVWVPYIGAGKIARVQFRTNTGAH